MPTGRKTPTQSTNQLAKLKLASVSPAHQEIQEHLLDIKRHETHEEFEDFCAQLEDDSTCKKEVSSKKIS